jgi:hypothetical protein
VTDVSEMKTMKRNEVDMDIVRVQRICLMTLRWSSLYS